MARQKNRRYVLFAVLGVAVVALLADRLGSRPKAATAQPASGSGAVTATAGWQDVGGAIQRWTEDAYAPLEPDFAAGERDLFVPTGAFEAIAARQAAPQVEVEQERTRAQREAEFRAGHTLTGVLLGKEPAAVMDGVLLHVNSDVDGYRVVEIRREQVVFQSRDDGHQIRMDVEPQPISP